MRVCAGRWSFKQVAAAAGISPRLVSAYERGTKPLSRETLDELGAAMGLSPEAVDIAMIGGEILHRGTTGRGSYDALPALPFEE
jgi:transcriptional regulator with XRE-family HTH domain